MKTIRKTILALALVAFATTAAMAERLSGCMLFNHNAARTMGLRTAAGLVALTHGADMKLDGIASLNDLAAGNVLDVDVKDDGPAQVITAVTLRSKNDGDCPSPTVPSVPASTLYRALEDKSAMVVDVRSAGEFGKEHFDGAVNIPLNELAGRLGEFPSNRPLILYCATARRSAFGAAILRQKGYDATIVKGSFKVKDGKPYIAE